MVFVWFEESLAWATRETHWSEWVVIKVAPEWFGIIGFRGVAIDGISWPAPDCHSSSWRDGGGLFIGFGGNIFSSST
jgi:hypothetical protein